MNTRPMAGGRSWVLCLCMMLIPAIAQAAMVISDGFALNGTTRVANGSVTGTFTEVGNAKWAGGAWKFDTTGAVVNSATQVQIVPHTITTAAAVSIDMNFSGYTGSNYAMVGINDTLPTQPYSWQVWLFIRGNGDWTLRQSTTTKASGTGLTTAGWHTFKIEYDPVTSTAGAWFDATPLATSISLPTLPTIKYAGFGSSAVTNMLADNFSLSVVPEPVTVSLLVLGGVMLPPRRRR